MGHLTYILQIFGCYITGVTRLEGVTRCGLHSPSDATAFQSYLRLNKVIKISILKVNALVLCC